MDCFKKILQEGFVIGTIGRRKSKEVNYSRHADECPHLPHALHRLSSVPADPETSSGRPRSVFHLTPNPSPKKRETVAANSLTGHLLFFFFVMKTKAVKITKQICLSSHDN